MSRRPYRWDYAAGNNGTKTGRKRERVSRRPYRWNYAALRPLDIGFCHARTPLGSVIRLFSGGGLYNHVWLATSAHGQLYATEMGARGCVETSLEHYAQGRVDTVPLVIRWDGWADVEAVEEWLAVQRRRHAEPRNYGWAAILQPWTWVRGGPIDRDGTRRMYCSELVARAMLLGGTSGTPPEWTTRWPSPNALAAYLLTRPDCRDVTREVQVVL